MQTFILYHYDPTLVGAMIFIVLFSIVTLYHTTLLLLPRFRAWFMIPLVLGGIFEIIAYVDRAISHYNPQSEVPFIISSVLALVAPALFAASIYMILGRIIRLLHAEHHSLIRVDRLTKIFVSCDIVSFFIQSGGAGLQASATESSIHIGQIIVIVALFLQMAIFGLFVMVAAIFQRRIQAQPTQWSLSSLPWQKHMISLYIASALILVRNIVRTAQYIQGYSGFINSHEIFLYMFDTLPMFFVMVVMAVTYAPKLLKDGKETVLDESKEKTKKYGPRVEMV